MWFGLILDGGVFCGHTERVEAYGVEDVAAIFAVEAGENVTDGVVADVSHVEGAGGVREHFEAEEFFT